MKRIKYLIFGMLMIIPTLKANAASGLIDIYSSNKTPLVGNSITVTVYCKSSSAIGTCEYTLNYNSSKLLLTSGALSTCDVANNNSTYSMSKSYTFKVIASGSSSVSVKSYAMRDLKTEAEMSTSVSATTITAKTQAEIEASYSNNNNLSNISIEGITLTPSFNKNTLEYKGTAEANVEKINIVAKAEDGTATIAGAGEKVLTDGDNKFEIKVTSQKGNTKTYIVTITVKDDNPINVKVNNETFSVVKKASGLPEATGYTPTTIKINDIEIPVLYSEITKTTLVGLKDSKSNISLYIYDKDNNSYSLYKEIKSNSMIIVPINTDKTLDLIKSTIEINKVTYDCYKFKGSSSYAILYAMNIETGETNWYVYEKTENTVQKYNASSYEYYINKEEESKKIIYILGGSTLLLGLFLITSNISKNKKIKKLKLNKHKEIKKSIVEEPVKEETTKIENLKDFNNTQDMIKKIDFDKTSTEIITGKKQLKKMKKVIDKQKKMEQIKEKKGNLNETKVNTKINEKKLDEW